MHAQSTASMTFQAWARAKEDNVGIGLGLRRIV